MSDATLFAAALEKADPADRAAFLAGACASDAGQLRRVEALLAAHDQAGNFLEPPARTNSIRGPGDGGEADGAEEPLTFLDPPIRPDAVGRLGHYEVLQVVGRGGFGIVFRAFDDVLQRVVAIKVLSPRMAATSPARQRFVREARGYAKIRHENVVQVHGIEAEPLPYLVMEFIPGETLERLLLRTGPLAAPDVVRIGAQVARGLAAAHAIGLVHRDIKPANILIEDGPDRRVKLTDFGLARAADDASLTQSGTIAGTPLYMAPEQAKGDSLDHRADLFSLGSVLYAMCTGRPPFRAPTSFAVLKRVVEDEPRPIRDVIPEVPQALCDVIGRLHAKNPDARIQSAAEVADLLGRCLADPPTRTDLSPVPPARRGATRRLAPVAAAALVGAAVAAYLLAPGRQPAGSAPPEPLTAVSVADRLTSPEWEWAPPERLGPGVNTTARELMATLTADEREVVFVRDRSLWAARRASPEEPFAAAEPVPTGVTAPLVQAPSLSGDGLLLAFAAHPGGKEFEAVWMASRESRDAPFGPARRLPAPVNGAPWSAAPVLSADGLTLLATSQIPGGTGKGDILTFTRPARGEPFGAGALLPPPVNSPVFDGAAWVSDDGRVLVRTRMDKPPFETRFHVRPDRAAPFGPPQAFVVPGVAGEVGRPWLSPDGMRLYFHSRELPGGAGDLDLWVSRRVPKAR
jgi:hypothetical protein